MRIEGFHGRGQALTYDSYHSSMILPPFGSFSTVGIVILLCVIISECYSLQLPALQKLLRREEVAGPDMYTDLVSSQLFSYFAVPIVVKH